MLNINEISDYRDMLKNYYTQRKLDMPLYSYKMMGQKLGLDTSQVFRILNKELHLPNRSIPLAKDLLDLKGRSGEIFEILVAASKTKSSAKKDKLYKMALSLQDVDLRKLSASEYLFLSKWWIPVVRALIEMNGGHAEIPLLVKQISPTVSEDQVREAITVLKDLKLITPLASERYAATTANNINLPFRVRIQERFESQRLGEDLAEVVIGDLRHIFHIGILGDGDRRNTPNPYPG